MLSQLLLVVASAALQDQEEMWLSMMQYQIDSQKAS
uniref:Uncharacterized protein n=1 Tax=Arundo donax TaxID=35708 RepID=A0A0A9FYP0_ARUDO